VFAPTHSKLEATNKITYPKFNNINQLFMKCLFLKVCRIPEKHVVRRFKAFLCLFSFGLCTLPSYAGTTNESIGTNELSYPIIQQATQTVSGEVLDTYGEPLIGVSIAIKGTTSGVITDLDGKFQIDVNQGSTLVFSYIGYVTQEVTITNQRTLNIKMADDTQTIDEVVVVGYGVQKKANLTGAVSAIDGETIAAKPASDVLSALQGELPGVAVVRTGGQPGSESSGIQIRGVSSTNNTSTLVLIDGVEGDLTLLNPNDIESISVLKDAAASSIYGARAAAGVVLVTTKNGQTGKTRVSYNGYFAINTPGNMPKRLPAWEEQEFINLSRVNDTGNPEWNSELSSWVANPNFNYRPNNSNGRWDFYQATNWVEEGTRDYTTQQNHSVSVSGGAEKMNYLVSANYFTKNGILKYGPDSNERYNLRTKLNADLHKYVTFGVNISYQGRFVENTPYNPKSLLERLYRVRGRQPIMNPEEDITDNPYNGDLQVNAIDVMKNGGVNKTKYEEFIGKGTVTLKDFVKGLRINLSASRKASYYSQTENRRTLIWYNRLGNGIRQSWANPNQLKKVKNSTTHDLLEATVNYDFKLGNHSFNLLGGSTYENYRKDEMEGTAKNMISNDFFSFNYYDSAEATNSELKDKIEPWSMMSYFGRINYSFADRYLFEANIRYDGSSRLAPDKRWKAFPSFSGAWRVSEEEWFNVEEITNLKARASWGQLGNGAVLGLYDYLPLISSGNLMGDGYYYQDVLASKEKTWETIQSTNIGLDLGMLNGKLNFTADYYWKYNKDMLAGVNLPNQIGIKTPNANIGKLKTWGWEFEIGWRDKIDQVNYQVSFNLSDSQNELQEYSGVNVVKAGRVELLEGYPINSIWGYKTNGFWSSREEYLSYKEANPGYESFQDGKVTGGDIKYVGQGNSNHKISTGGGTPDDPGDLVYLGNTNARYRYGLNLSLQWKNFDFSMMWEGVGKRNVVIDGATMCPLAYSQNMPWTIHRDYWTPDNQDAYWPRIYNYNGSELYNYHTSDKWVQDASYIRLKNLTIGYTIPLKGNYIERCRVYVTGSDIWEHSNMLSVFDPEVGYEKNNSGVLQDVKADAIYPFFRTWTVGLNVTF